MSQQAPGPGQVQTQAKPPPPDPQTPAGSPKHDVILVFDFDQTLVLHDSDVHVPTFLGSEAALAQLKYKPSDPAAPANYPTWNAKVDKALLTLQSEGKSKLDIESACTQIPYDDETLQVVRLANALNIPVHIVSDSNETYISAFLNGLPPPRLQFASVETNPTHVDRDNNLRIRPYHGDGHLCLHCPPHMCKSLILDKILAERYYPARPRIFYFGDGYGDFCPVSKVLGPNDVAVVRFDERAPKAQTLKRLVEQNPPRCRVEYFARGPDLLAMMKRLVFDLVR